MTTSENPLTRVYWEGVVDARILALFRICLGVALVQDLLPRIRHASTFLTDDGVFPRELLPSDHAWSLFDLTGEGAPVMVILAAGTIATFAFTLGYATRAAAAASWVFWVSLHRRVPAIHTGGDSMADIMLFFGAFTDLSGRWSLDAIRRGVRAEVPAFVPRLMQLCPAALYLYTARAKLRTGGGDWLFGPIIFEHMHLQGWIRPAGVVLGEYPRLCALFSGGTIIIESLLFFLLLLPFWIPQSRALAVILHLALQLGILFTMKVGIFTNVMLAITCLWLRPAWLDAAGGVLAVKNGSYTRPPPRYPRGRTALNGALFALFLGALACPMIPRHLPHFVGVVVQKCFGLDIAAGLFLKGYPSVRWEATGVLADGTTIDPIAAVAPDADFSNDFLNNLWMQLPYRLEQYGPLGQFVCDRYNRRTDRPALSRWKLESLSRAPYAPGETPPLEGRRRVLERECIRQ
jgi:Vitamin K-dependent gamma-carboxylase